MSSPLPLTAALQEIITAYARAGGFVESAAEAAGVPAAVFADWMHQGERPDAHPPFADFARAVRAAQAQGRLRAEIDVRESRPLDWLRYGPGRDSARLPGWGAAVKPRVGPLEEAAPLESPAVRSMLSRILSALAPFPEARAALADLFAEK